MIVDCHVHLNNYHESERAPTHENLQRLEKAMEAAGVDHAVVLTSYTVNDARPGVDEVLGAIRDDPARFSLVAGLGLTRPTVDWSHLRRHLEAGEVRGLKLYPGYEYFYPHDTVCEPVYELAAEFDVPVMVHSGDTYAPAGKIKYSHPIHLDEAAVDHPDVTFVLCHLGNPWMTTAAEVVYKNDNVYADLSGLVTDGFDPAVEDQLTEKVQDLIDYLGEPGKLLFGTDWPIAPMADYVRFAEALLEPCLDPAQCDRVMGGNAVALFGIDAGGG